MDWIFALQKELGSVRGLPEDMRYIKNAMIILGEARKEQTAQQSGGYKVEWVDADTVRLTPVRREAEV